MKNLFKNNLFKLPIFLMIVGVICTASLSIVNYFTSTKIEANSQEQVLNACKSSFNNHENYASFVITEVDCPTSLKEVGITKKNKVEDSSSLIGYVYVGSVQGFADKIDFVVSYEGGKLHKIKVTYEQESNKKGINYIKSNYVDYDLTKPNFFETSDYSKGVAGASMTGKKGLIDAINKCSEDYLSTK